MKALIAGVVALVLAGCDLPVAPGDPDVQAPPRLADLGSGAPDAYSPPENLALNPSRSGYPHPLDSDAGWGGGADVWDIVDGTRNYTTWSNGLAFTGGTPGYVAPCGDRQATVVFSGPTSFNRIVVWHHGSNHVPNSYAIDYWDGSQWVEILSTTTGRDFRVFPEGGPNWWNGWSTPTENVFPTVTGSQVRLRLNNCDIEHGWIYSFEVYDDAPPEPPGVSPPENLAANPARSGYPHPLDSDAGWGGGADVWDILDGTRNYNYWGNGLAFTGGYPGYVEPCGDRQATVTFAGPTTFDRVMVWHHGYDHVPNSYALDYWDGSQWLELFSTTTGWNYKVYPHPDGDPNWYWWQAWSTPTENAFPTVTGSKVRLRLNNCDIMHGWIYSFEVYLDGPANTPPTADPGGPYAGDEGSAVALDLTGSDPDGDGLTYTWDLGDGSAGSGPTPPLSHTWTDDGSYTVVLTADDGNGGSDTRSTTVDIANVAPTVTSLIGPTEPIRLEAGGAVAALDYSFADPAGGWDTYWTSVDCGNGTDLSDAGITSPHTASCTYTEAGVYVATVTVSDEDGGTSAESLFRYVVVFDPEGGFVTGGGWIDSPAGACTWDGCAADGSTTGKASFGFVSKYRKGADTPSGNTEFQFRAGDLDFKSSAYQWLVVAGPRAQFKGEGTIDGGGDYAFLLTAVDGQRPGGGEVDRFRIKIWDRALGEVVYDNQRGEDDDSPAATALEGGSIVIHDRR